MMRRAFLTGLAILAALNASAAASAEKTVPAPPVSEDVKGRLLQPVPGKAVVYVLRPLEDIWHWRVPVHLDAREVAVTTPNTYLRWELEPGQHTIVSATTPPAVLQLNAVPGAMYFVWQDVNTGFLRPASRLQQVDKTTAGLVLTSSCPVPSAVR